MVLQLGGILLSILHSRILCMGFPLAERMLLQLKGVSALDSAFQDAVLEISVLQSGGFSTLSCAF
jgi:hypothetical protein